MPIDRDSLVTRLARQPAHLRDELLREHDQHPLAQLGLAHLRWRRAFDRHGIRLAGAIDAQRAGLGAPGRGITGGVGVARDGAQVHDVAGLQSEAVESQRAGELQAARVVAGRASKHRGARLEALATPRRDDDLEPSGDDADVVPR